MSPIKTTPIDLTEDDIERFWGYVNYNGPNGCWMWDGPMGTYGYGVIGANNKLLMAHRISETIARGDPGPLYVCHRCDNPRCVNPDHLFAGTQDDNMKDMVCKGRSCRGEKSGHAKLTADKVRKARELVVSGEQTQQAIAREYGVIEATLNQAIHGRSWSHVTEGADAIAVKAGRLQSGERNTQSKLTSVQVIEIRRIAANGEETQLEIAKRFGVVNSTISRIVTGKSWKQ